MSMFLKIVSALLVVRFLYSWSFSSKTQYQNPERNITEIITGWGFKAEEHYLTTEDGYKILVERAYGNVTQDTPIILSHGMLMNSLSFVIQEERSLTHFLCKWGYEVWLINIRGTKYSRGHTKLTPEDHNYWNFTLDVAANDIRSTMKYVHTIRKRKAIYIGFSMSTTLFFIYSTTFPEESRQFVEGMIGIGPAINFKDILSPIRYVSPFWSIAKSSIVYNMYNGETHSGLGLMKKVRGSNIGDYMIKIVIGFFFGDDCSQMDTTALLRTTESIDSTGAEMVTQYFQIYESGIFQKYDYGKQENLELYCTETPPTYNLANVSVPVAVYCGANDYMASITNCRQIYNELSAEHRCGYWEHKDWGHANLLLAKDVMEHINLNIIDKINDMKLGRCGT